jgi:hypothetical protein
MSKNKKNGLNAIIETVEPTVVDDSEILNRAKIIADRAKQLSDMKRSITNEIPLDATAEIVSKGTIDSERLDRYNEIMAKLGHRK